MWGVTLRALASPMFSAARQSPSKLGLCACLKKTLPFGYSVALSGRSREGRGNTAVTQGAALGYVLLPLRGAGVDFGG